MSTDFNLPYGTRLTNNKILKLGEIISPEQLKKIKQDNPNLTLSYDEITPNHLMIVDFKFNKED